jgi:hypothetical protein
VQLEDLLRTENENDTAQRGHYDPDRANRLRVRMNDGLAHDRILNMNSVIRPASVDVVMAQLNLFTGISFRRETS